MAEEFATSRKKCVRCSTPGFATRLDVSPAVGAQMMILLQCESSTKQGKAVLCHELCASWRSKKRILELPYSTEYRLLQSRSSQCIRG